MILTIAIPTYNRNEILKQSLALLLPQLTQDCELLVIDNCSEVPVVITLSDLLDGYPDVSKRMVRNRVNIGGGANILRCFELCETEWLWVLGDDDTVCENSISLIFDTIRAFPKAVFINFSSPRFNRLKTFMTHGAEEFVKEIDSFSKVLFTSACLFKAQELRPQMRFGYLSCYAWAPQIGMLLTTLKNNDLCCFLNFSVIASVTRAPVDSRLSALNFSVGLPSLLDLPMSIRSRRYLSAKMTDISLPYIVALSIAHAISGNDTESALFVYDTIHYRKYYFNKSLFLRFKIFAFRWLIRFPKMGKRVVNVYYKLLKNQSGCKDEDWLKCFPNRWNDRV